MKLPDVNVLLYAVDETSPRHDPAARWVEDALSGTETIAFAWSVLQAFLRLSTQPLGFERPLEVEQGLDLIDSWLAQPCATIVEPTGRHTSLLRELLGPLGTAGNLVTDAHLAGAGHRARSRALLIRPRLRSFPRAPLDGSARASLTAGYALAQRSRHRTSAASRTTAGSVPPSNVRSRSTAP